MDYADSRSIFPLVADIFSWLRNIDADIRKLHTMIQAKIPQVNTDVAFNFWDNFLKNEDIWYTILGREGPTRILLLNQNSDELRAGG
jgi:hypothetical protein